MKEKLHSAIVTTGGTREPLDDVRFITNFATGKFGYAIAGALDEAGFDVTVLCPPEVPLVAGGKNENLTHKPFGSTESLKDTLLTEGKPAIVFHAAAVSDYRPKMVTEGKISSSKDELIIELEKTPKILASLREYYGNESFLIGFKLLSNVARQELIRVALNQTKRDHLNMTVANDLKNLHDGQHPIIMVTAEGGAINVGGDKKDVAKKLVEFVKKRADVTWYKSEKTHLENAPTADWGRFSKAVHFAQDSNLLYDSSGNVSVKSSDMILVTPRQVDKSTHEAFHGVKAKVKHEEKKVYYDGQIKASIDTAVADAIYQKYPNVKTLLHFHRAWGKALDKTTFPYPCGVKEEADEILEVLEKNGVAQDSSEFAIELSHHGFLMALPDDGVDRLESEWKETLSEFEKHLEDVGMPQAMREGVFKPIFSNTEIIGVIREHDDGATVFLGEKSRGKGVGRKIVEELTERETTIQTIEACGVLGFYRKFGFKEDFDEATGVHTFTPPPTEATDPLFDRLSEWKVN